MTQILKVLHADDESDILEIVDLCLGLDGAMELKSCTTGERLLEMARESKPDLILLDVSMPGQDGPTTFKLLRADSRTADIPVIFITARASATDQADLMAQGAIGVLSKPFDPITLASQVREIFSQ